MNERIKEMWEEATLSHWPRPGKFTAGEYDSHLEKFAELIVGECISCLNDGAIQAGDVRTTVGTVEKTLKQHFGVE